MWDFFLKLEIPVQAALVSATATCASALVGFTAVFVQIGRQGRNAIAANTKNEQLKRKVEIYERTLEISQTAQVSAIELIRYLRNYSMSLVTAGMLHENQLPWHLPNARYPEYLQLRSKATEDIIAVMNLIESWHIIEPRLDVFRMALSMGLNDHTKAVTPPDLFVYKMPVVGHEKDWKLPSRGESSELEYRIQREIDQIQRLSNWIGDFKVEMQVLLLGELFPNSVERRDPPDPDQFCIRLDRYDDVMRKINSSEWMRDAEQYSAEAWVRFAAKNQTQ